MRPVCVLIAVLFVAGCLHELHALPIGVQFIRRDKWHGRATSAAHFAAVRDDVHRAVGVDRKPYIWRERALQCTGAHRFRRTGRACIHWHQTHAQHKRACSEQSFEESTTAHVFDANPHHAPSDFSATYSPNPNAIPLSCKSARAKIRHALITGLMREAKLDEVKTILPARRRAHAANRRFGPDDTHCGRQEAALRAEWSARRRAESSRTNRSWDS